MVPRVTGFASRGIPLPWPLRPNRLISIQATIQVGSPWVSLILGLGFLIGLALLPASVATTSGYTDPAGPPRQLGGEVLLLQMDADDHNVPSSSKTRDSTANSNHAEYLNGANQAVGKFGNGYHLDGSVDFLRIQDAPSLKPTTALTAMLWYKADAYTASEQALFNKYDTLNPPAGGYFIHLVNDGQTVRGGVQLNGVLRTVERSVPADNAWHHYAVIYTGSMLWVSVDGAFTGQSYQSQTIDHTNYGPQVGATVNGGAVDAHGIVDEVRVFNRGLDAAEVDDIMNGPYGAPGSTTSTSTTATTTSSSTTSTTLPPITTSSMTTSTSVFNPPLTSSSSSSTTTSTFSSGSSQENGTSGGKEGFFSALSTEARVVLIGAGVALAVPAAYFGINALRQSRKPQILSPFAPVAGRTRPLAGAPVAAVERAQGADLMVHDFKVLRNESVVLDQISFQIPRASMMMLLGPSGSGKSTLLKALVGLVPAQGDLWVGNRWVHPGSNDLKRLVGYVPQELQLYDNLDALQNIAYFASQFGLSSQEAESRAQALLADLGLVGLEHRLLREMSGGQQRRVSIAAALVHEPRLIILDEPSSGLDYSARKSLWGVLERLTVKRGVSILATTHFIDDADYGNLVGIMFRGRLVALGSQRDLIEALPGDTRCVEIEFEDLTPPQQQKLRQLLPSLKSQGVVEQAEYQTYSVRYFCKDPPRVARVLPPFLYKQSFKVRTTRIDDVTLQDVFVFHTGQSFEEAGR